MKLAWLKKTVMTALMTIVASQALAAPQPDLNEVTIPELTCTNVMYRDALLDLSPDRGITIRDSFVEGRQALADHLAKRAGNARLLIQDVSLEVGPDDLVCTSVGNILFTCNATAREAVLRVRGWLRLGDGQSTMQEFVEPVSVRSLVVKSALTSEGGPHVISNTATNISLSRLQVNAEADIILFDTAEFSLKWTPFFHKGPNGKHSSCKQQ